MIDQAIVASIPSMVGNGGLSFRHIPTMLKALAAYPNGNIKATNEDVFYSKAFTLMDETMPTRAEALEFCVEQVPELGYSHGDAQAMGVLTSGYCEGTVGYEQGDIKQNGVYTVLGSARVFTRRI